MKMLERTSTIDFDLARRADRKLRRYGSDLNHVLSVIVTVRGRPSYAASEEVPGKLLLKSFRESEDMEAGRAPMKTFANVDDLFADCLA